MKTTILESERAKFDRMAKEWHGKMRTDLGLDSDFAPLRLRFLHKAIKLGQPRRSKEVDPGVLEKQPLKGFRILDVGCGGGVISERLAAAGADVTAIDISSKSIEANVDAYPHTDVKYKYGSIEEHVTEVLPNNASGSEGLITFLWRFINNPFGVPTEKPGKYDIIVASEVIEHVQRPRLFLKSVDQLLSPGGLLVVTTPNRNPISRFFFITVGENWLRFLPRGTHEYRLFVKPRELAAVMNRRPIRPSLLDRVVPERLKKHLPMPPPGPLRDTDEQDKDAVLLGDYVELCRKGVVPWIGLRKMKPKFVGVVPRFLMVPCTLVHWMAAYRKESYHPTS